MNEISYFIFGLQRENLIIQGSVFKQLWCLCLEPKNSASEHLISFVASEE
jgi:hypothetical protein